MFGALSPLSALQILLQMLYKVTSVSGNDARHESRDGMTDTYL